MTPSKPAASWAGLTARVAAHLNTPLFRNGYALLLSGAATSALGLAYWAVAARMYPTEVVGRNSAVLAAISLLSVIGQLSLSNVLVRFLPEAGRASAKLIGYSYAACLLATAVVGSVFLGGLKVWSPALTFIVDSPGWLGLFAMGLFTWGIFTLQDSALTGLRDTVWVPVENTIFAVLKLVLVGSLAVALPQVGILASWTVPVAVSLLPVNAIIFGRSVSRRTRIMPAQDSPLRVADIVRFAGGNYLGLLLLTAYTAVLPLIVANLAGEPATAYFYLPWTVASGMQLIATNLVTSMTVEAATHQAQLADYSRRVVRQALRLLLPIVAVMLIGAPWLLGVLGADYAEEGAGLLRYLSLATLPNLLVVLGVGIVRVQNRPGWIAVIHAGLGAMVLGLTYAWLPRLGIGGVGLAWLVAQTVVAAGLIAFVLRPVWWPATSVDGGRHQPGTGKQAG